MYPCRSSFWYFGWLRHPSNAPPKKQPGFGGFPCKIPRSVLVSTTVQSGANGFVETGSPERGGLHAGSSMKRAGSGIRTSTLYSTGKGPMLASHTRVEQNPSLWYFDTSYLMMIIEYRHIRIICILASDQDGTQPLVTSWISCENCPCESCTPFGGRRTRFSRSEHRLSPDHSHRWESSLFLYPKTSPATLTPCQAAKKHSVEPEPLAGYGKAGLFIVLIVFLFISNIHSSINHANCCSAACQRHVLRCDHFGTYPLSNKQRSHWSGKNTRERNSTSAQSWISMKIVKPHDYHHQQPIQKTTEYQYIFLSLYIEG